MTRPDRPDDDHDDALQQAWRASSRETPPPELDASILAAAHRAVGSAPRTAGGEAVRPPRWWMPFAAAAVIGAVAVGVVQLAPHEPAIAVTSGESAKPDARVAMAPPAPPPASASPASSAASPPASAMGAAGTTASSKREASPPAAVAPTPAATPPPVPAPSPAPRAQVEAAKPTIAAAPEPQPFPAAKLARQQPAQDTAAPSPATANPAAANRMADAAIPRESAEARASQRGDAQGRVAAAPPPPPAPAPARAAAIAPAAPAPPPVPSPMAASTPPTPAAQGAAPRAATATAPTAERARDGFTGNLAQTAKQRPAPSAEALERAKDPDAWIVRIRKLRDGGREAEAIKELHEFDALVPDAAQRMPSELRRLMQRDPVN